jgi:opacity protein-like surface antigen
MKLVTSTAIAALLLGAPAAFAADVYHQGGMKDEGPQREYRTGTHGGWYIKGNLGIAQGDRDVNMDLKREKGTFEIETGDTPEDAPEGFEPTETRVETPQWIDRLVGGESKDLEATVFGGELSYLYQRPGSRFGFEVGLGGTGYANSETKHGFEDASATIIGGSLSDPDTCTNFCVGDEAGTTQSGFLSVKRQFDVDLVGRVHYFLMEDLALNAGGGLSVARAKLKGGATTNSPIGGGAYDTDFDDTDTSIGYVLTAGATWWISDRWTLGLVYDYKVHEFEGKVGRTTDDENEYRTVNHNVTVEDELHTIKAQLGLKLGGPLPSLD